MRNHLWSLALSCMLGAGCSAALPLKETRSDEAESGRTYLLLTHQVKGGETLPTGRPCELRAKNQDDGKSYALPLRPKGSSLLVEVVPGRYSWDALVCSNSQNWSISSPLSLGVPVQPGKLNYGGHLRFALSEQDTRLTASYGARAEGSSALAGELKAIPARVRTQTIAAYSGKPFSLETVAARGPQQRTIQITKKGQDKLKTDELNAELDRCERQEQEENPVRLGQLAYEARYEGGSLKKIERVTDRHTFSDRYVDCVEGAFKAYRPGSEAAIAYRVQL